MQLFCPTCQAAFPGTQRCPRCGGLLLMPQEAAENTPTARDDRHLNDLTCQGRDRKRLAPLSELPLCPKSQPCEGTDPFACQLIGTTRKNKYPDTKKSFSTIPSVSRNTLLLRQ